jgi:hypothetical protein
MYLRPAEGQNRSLAVGNPGGLAYWQLVRPWTDGCGLQARWY